MKKSLTLCVVLSALSLSFVSGCGLDSETPRISDQQMIFLSVKGENTILLCTDGLDNDNNGKIDCEDSGCQNKGTAEIPGPGTTVCPGTDVNGVWVPAENTDYACSDGIDNDGNGYTDCADNNCKQLSVCCVKTGDENTVAACSDGIDNDCDGYVDCGDFSCKGGNSKDSKATEESINYCTALEYPNGKVTVPENTLETCSDGIDNDGDGYTDCADYSCNGLGKSKDSQATKESKEYCSIKETAENSEETCSDAKDNDLDGLIDCDDPDCSSVVYCLDKGAEPGSRPADFDKLSSSQRAAILAQEKLLCTDGVDNNKNGKIDCAEYQCHILSVRSQNLSDSEKIYAFTCQESEETQAPEEN